MRRPSHRHRSHGDEARAIIKGVGDDRPVVDILWFHDDYLALFDTAGLELVAEHRPRGRDDDPYEWISESSVPPWVIYVLKPT